MPMINLPIETGRLLLRPLLETDEQGMFELDADPDVHQYLGNKPLTSIAQSREVIVLIRQQYADYGIGRWAVIEKQSGLFIGWAGLKYIPHIINNHSGFYEVGYRFIKRFWGKGYATEAARATLRYGFETMGLPVIYGMCHAANAGSKHVLEKGGLAYINHFDLDGIAHLWFKLDSTDWVPDSI